MTGKMQRSARVCSFLAKFWCGSIRTTVGVEQDLTVTKRIQTSTLIRSFWQSLFYRPLQLRPREGLSTGCSASLPVSLGLSRFGILSRITALVFVFSCALGAAASRDHPIIFKAGQKTGYAEGQFTGNTHVVYFSFHARTGQHVCVKIMPLTRGLITAGVVVYPSGKQDGGPGGTVFDSDLTERGKYRVRVTQRQVEIKGRFRVQVEISPQ